MPIEQVIDEDQRLCLIRALEEAGGQANESVAQSCLEVYGHAISRDKIRTHYAWLQEQRVVTIKEVAGYQVARLTERGYDAVKGRCEVPGIKSARGG